MISEQLKALKNQKNLTAQEIADRSGVPVSTVNKILTGQTDNPSFKTICDMVKAMEGSVDELIGIRRANTLPAVDDMARAWVNAVQPFRESLDTKDKWIHRLFRVCCAMLCVLVFILVYDLLNPNAGWFRQ